MDTREKLVDSIRHRLVKERNVTLWVTLLVALLTIWAQYWFLVVGTILLGCIVIIYEYGLSRLSTLTNEQLNYYFKKR